MRILVAAVGRLKQGPERELAERYAKRASDAGRAIGIRPVEIVEVRESRARETEKRINEEAIALASLTPERAIVVVLDERGTQIDSAAFADRLQRWRAEDRPATAFIIGGADGLAPSLSARANLRLAFGALTFPHQLVRIMLLEQIYRAATILSGHPYHRA